MIELPFKLLLMCCLLALLIPTTALSYRHVSRIRLEDSVEEIIEDILSKASRMAIQDDRSRTLYSFEIEEGHMANLDYIRVGGKIGEGDNMIEYRMGWWSNPKYIYVENFGITSNSNSTYELRSGRQELALTKITISEEPIVVISGANHNVDPADFLQ